MEEEAAAKEKAAEKVPAKEFKEAQKAEKVAEKEAVVALAKADETVHVLEEKEGADLHDAVSEL